MTRKNPYSGPRNAVRVGFSWLAYYVMGWFCGVAIVYSGAWLFINFIGWLIFGTDPISGNPGLGG